MPNSKYSGRIPASVLGVVFIVSGIMKLQDTVGTGLIVEEYFKFLGLGTPAGDLPLMKALGLGLSLLESILGVLLVCGIFRKTAMIASGAAMLGFTGLTLALLIRNPEMDCGCFGEIIHLSHRQSFIKNLILDGLWMLAFLPCLKRGLGRPHWRKYISASLSATALVCMGVWSSTHLPLIDSTSLSAGTEIGVSDEDAAHLSIRSASGRYHDSLLQRGPVMVVSFFDNEEDMTVKSAKAEEFLQLCEGAGMRALLLDSTSSLADSYFADRRDLLSLNRSNGGATFIYDGQIVKKWRAQDYPAEDELFDLLDTDTTELISKDIHRSNMVFEGTLAGIILLLLLI